MRSVACLGSRHVLAKHKILHWSCAQSRRISWHKSHVRGTPSRCSSENNNNGSQAPLPNPGLEQKFDRRKAQQIDIDGRNVLNGDRGSLLESPFVSKAKELWGRFIYTYFNWRKDAWADVQLLLFLNGGVVLLAGLAKRVLIDGMEPDVPGVWNDVYEVLTTWFGDFPEAESISRQVFSVSVAIIGLAAFAIVLALVEQIVLQILTENVSRGSVVYEKGHILVLAWANTQRDREVIWKILAQLCLAYRTDGGRVIVVLSGVLKTEMEETFRVIIPESERYGSTFVFRQGNPLLPDDLRTVAASAAAATVIVSDTSRGPGEADSQSLRAAVLLDELDFPGAGKPDPRRGYIVVGLQTQEATGLLKYSCSERVVPVPTNNLNARRISRNIQYPVLTYVSQMLLNFRSRAQGYLMSFQTIQGMRFGELFRVFPDAIVLGVSNKVTGKTKLNPPADFQIGPDESLVLMRPTSIPGAEYRPLKKPLNVDLGDWSPDGYVMRSRDEQPVRVRGSSSMDETSCSSAITGQPLVIKGPRKKKGGPSQAAGCYILPMEYSATSEDPVNVLVCGWGDSTFMISLLHSMDAELPQNSQITLLNLQRKEDVLGVAREAAQMSRVSCIHVYGDPLKYRDLELKLEVQRFNSAIVLCDAAWVDPDQNAANGIALKTKDDMLRLDSMVMSVQLSIRKLLEERGFPDINIITEKVAFQGITRFEDRGRMPLGSVFNITSFSARILSQAIYNPKAVMAYSEFGKDTEMMVQDSSSFAHEGEEVSFLQLQARAMEVSQVLVGFYDIPKSVEQPLQLVINPEGVEARTRKVVWNRNDNRVKLICLCKKSPVVDVKMPPSPVTETLPGDGNGTGEPAATQSMW